MNTFRLYQLHAAAAAIVLSCTLLLAAAGAMYGQRCDGCDRTEPFPDSLPASNVQRSIEERMAATLNTDVVSEWNDTAVALSLSATPALSPVQQTRVMAIFHIAVNDAVNGLTGKYATYLDQPRAPSHASAEAAAIAAAHYALKEMFPTQATMLDTLYANSLAVHGIATNDRGIAFGERAASAILMARANDNSANAQFDYTAPGAGTPGVWTRINNAPALLPGWGNVKLFVLRRPDQFRVPPPPALDGDVYARDYNELKEIGSLNSATRTPEQTQIAMFWRASPTAIWNAVLKQALGTRRLGISSTARLYAAFYIAATDAGIACWYAKYEHNFWRPQLAIRGGDLDGNDATTADPTWLPLVSTPPHPDYTSGHTTNSSAMAHVLKSVFGRRLNVPIEVTLSGITRTWQTFDEAVDEVIDARVYSGIHYRNSDEIGARQGRQIAQFVLTHSLKPCHGRGPRCR